MKRISDKTGRFAYRPYYDDGELDDFCEATITSYMMDHSGGLTLPIPTDRLITLIERDAAELDCYADLSAEGPDVQGLTLFQPSEKPLVSIDSSLSQPYCEHRLRTTLAHEWCHMALHDGPFQEKAAARSLFEDGRTDPVRCKRDNIIGARQTDWMEWQAGYVCGALLMPKSYVLASASRFCERYRCHGKIMAGTGWVGQLAGHIAGDFKVSQDAARVRIIQIGLVRDNPADLTLRSNRTKNEHFS